MVKPVSAMALLGSMVGCELGSMVGALIGASVEQPSSVLTLLTTAMCMETPRLVIALVMSNELVPVTRLLSIVLYAMPRWLDALLEQCILILSGKTGPPLAPMQQPCEQQKSWIAPLASALGMVAAVTPIADDRRLLVPVAMATLFVLPADRMTVSIPLSNVPWPLVRQELRLGESLPLMLISPLVFPMLKAMWPVVLGMTRLPVLAMLILTHDRLPLLVATAPWLVLVPSPVVPLAAAIDVPFLADFLGTSSPPLLHVLVETAFLVYGMP